MDIPSSDPLCFKGRVNFTFPSEGIRKIIKRGWKYGIGVGHLKGGRAGTFSN